MRHRLQAAGQGDGAHEPHRFAEHLVVAAHAALKRLVDRLGELAAHILIKHGCVRRTDGAHAGIEAGGIVDVRA